MLPGALLVLLSVAPADSITTAMPTRPNPLKILYMSASTLQLHGVMLGFAGPQI